MRDGKKEPRRANGEARETGSAGAPDLTAKNHDHRPIRNALLDRDPCRTVTDGRETLGYVFEGEGGGFDATDAFGEIIGEHASINGAVDMIFAGRRNRLEKSLAGDV